MAQLNDHPQRQTTGVIELIRCFPDGREELIEKDNLVLDRAYEVARDAFATGTSNVKINSIVVGDMNLAMGQTTSLTPQPTDTSLINQIAAKDVARIDTALTADGTNTLTAYFEFTENELLDGGGGDKQLAEYGLLTADGRMICRAVKVAVKSSSFGLSIRWTLKFALVAALSAMMPAINFSGGLV